MAGTFRYDLSSDFAGGGDGDVAILSGTPWSVGATGDIRVGAILPGDDRVVLGTAGGYAFGFTGGGTALRAGSGPLRGPPVGAVCVPLAGGLGVAGVGGAVGRVGCLCGALAGSLAGPPAKPAHPLSPGADGSGGSGHVGVGAARLDV